MRTMTPFRRTAPATRANGVAALAVIAALMAGCAGGGGAGFSIADMQRRLDDRGVGFGLTSLPGEKEVLFAVRFKTSAADAGGPGVTPDLDIAAAAALAAPPGCKVGAITPLPDGAAKVAYVCP